ncbi:hypothetical protein B0T12DRAFT_162218 [Alternaria alternata]|nr:hypothetical protein B0T12DRAFT_162218 [Alternaria alternata]
MPSRPTLPISLSLIYPFPILTGITSTPRRSISNMDQEVGFFSWYSSTWVFLGHQRRHLRSVYIAVVMWGWTKKGHHYRISPFPRKAHRHSLDDITLSFVQRRPKT